MFPAMKALRKAGVDMKILASDYDGTLNYGGFDERKISAIARWRAAGNLFGLVSGRSMDACLRLAGEGGFGFDFMIANNGAVVTDREGRLLYEKACDGSLALPLVRSMFEWGCPSAGIVVGLDYGYGVKPTAGQCRERDYTPENLPPVPRFYQISTILPTEELSRLTTERIRERFGDQINPLQNGICIDCVSVGADKAQGIRRLIEALGADESDVITVGDNVNDTDMIAAFRSYAMASGVESIKKLAGEVTPGIAELIERELEG